MVRTLSSPENAISRVSTSSTFPFWSRQSIVAASLPLRSPSFHSALRTTMRPNGVFVYEGSFSQNFTPFTSS